MSSPELLNRLKPALDDHVLIKGALKRARRQVVEWHHSTAALFPVLIQPRPRQLTIAVTAKCNLGCKGCRYGRDFMVGQQLDFTLVRDLLEDARQAGVTKVRLYGGEPLLHADLSRMVQHATHLGMQAYVTTNGTLLDRRIDSLYAAGLRLITIGFYGQGETYDEYTDRPNHFKKLERSLTYVREQYGEKVELQLNYVLVRTSCSLEALQEAWEFAQRYQMYFHVDLASYSLPFFTSGPDQMLAFRPGDLPAMQQVSAALVALKQQFPEKIPRSVEFLRSIPDWLNLGPAMRVPCDAYDLIWVGADGSVQLCDAAFPLGNLRETRLRDILFGDSHKQACRDAFQLKCPNCNCKADTRILADRASRIKYS